MKLNIQEWEKREHNAICIFLDWWADQQRKHGKRMYPDKMSPSDWDEQYQGWCGSL